MMKRTHTQVYYVNCSNPTKSEQISLLEIANKREGTVTLESLLYQVFNSKPSITLRIKHTVVHWRSLFFCNLFNFSPVCLYQFSITPCGFKEAGIYRKGVLRCSYGCDIKKRFCWPPFPLISLAAQPLLLNRCMVLAHCTVYVQMSICRFSFYVII